MKQLTIISGKGGTGKTTLVAAFASLAEDIALADCDCDAPDLQMILTPDVQKEEDYFGSATAVRTKDCSMCNLCKEKCRYDAIDDNIRVNEMKCEGCGVCVFVCPENAIEMRNERTGTVFESQTRFGPMVYAELGIGEEATGKMVNQVRSRALDIADSEDLIIVDGSPGVGCPVIASIKGVDQVLAVTEPTVSGVHDLKRVLEVAEHFGIKTSVCVNKYDINLSKTQEIKDFCNQEGIPVLGEIPYDNIVTEAMIEEKTVIEYSDSELAEEIRKLWKRLESVLEVD